MYSWYKPRNNSENGIPENNASCIYSNETLNQEMGRIKYKKKKKQMKLKEYMKRRTLYVLLHAEMYSFLFSFSHSLIFNQLHFPNDEYKSTLSLAFCQLHTYKTKSIFIVLIETVCVLFFYKFYYLFLVSFTFLSFLDSINEFVNKMKLCASWE